MRGTEHIFYIDDDKDDLEFFNDAIVTLGLKASMFDIPEALSRAMENPPPAPSVLFMDLNMPIKSGFQILHELRNSKAFKNLPLVIYSTAKDPNTIRRCLELGASLYINKPTTSKGIIHALEHVLAIEWKSFRTTRDNFVFLVP